MKSAHPEVLRLLRLSRIVRPILDITLLGLCLLGYVLVREHTRETQTHNPAHLHLFKTLAQQASPSRTSLSFESTDQQFKSESDMWAGFQSWLATHGSRSGQCNFSVSATELPYRMQCTGVHTSLQKPAGQTEWGAMPRVLAQGPVVRQIPQAETETKPGFAQDVQNRYTVQGWVDTDQGRKHFDPKTRQWTR
jgi:hypothetical protein